MSMVSGITQTSVPSGVHEMRPGRIERQERAEKAAERKLEAVPEGGRAPAKADAYIHGEKPVPAGLYRMSKDDDGNPKIIFDDPSSNGGEEAGAPEGTPAGPPADGKKAEAAPESPKGGKEATEKSTVNTDKVDREIRKLKEKKAGLEQQLARAADDPDKQKELQAQLQQVEGELRMKDNDTYRRQHSELT